MESNTMKEVHVPVTYL